MNYCSNGMGAIPIPETIGKKFATDTKIHRANFLFKEKDGTTYEISFGYTKKELLDECIAQQMKKETYVSHKYLDPNAPAKAEQFDGDGTGR